LEPPQATMARVQPHIVSASDESSAVGREGNSVNWCDVQSNTGNQFATAHVPECNHMVVTCRDHLPAVWRESY
jgi:hypothetical protein